MAPEDADFQQGRGIAMLPMDVLCAVFLLGANAADLSKEELTTMVLHISHVCQDWRNTSLSLSALWTRIDMMWEPARREAWLARSGLNRPLHLYLHQSHVVPEHWDISALINQSARWASVDVNMADEERLLEVIGLIMSLKTLVNLESLSLGDGHDPPTRFDLGDATPYLPALKSLAIVYLQLDHVEKIAEHLTDLTITGMEYAASEWVPMLEASRDLETLDVYGDVIHDHPPAKIGLPRLRELRISWAEEGTLGFLFRTLRCPGLQLLSIELTQSPRNRDSYIPPMLSFFQQTRELAHLTVADEYDPDEDQCSLHILDMLATRQDDYDPEHTTLLPALDSLFLCTDSLYLRAFIDYRLAHLFPNDENGKALAVLGLNQCSDEIEREWLAQRVDKLVVDPFRICVRPQWTPV